MHDAPGPGPDHRQLALLVDSAVDHGIFLLDVEGRVQTWNAGAERMTGFPAALVVGHPIAHLCAEEDRDPVAAAAKLQQCVEEGRHEEESWHLHRDGTRFWAHIVTTPVRDADGALLGFGVVSQDMTARRAAEEQSRARTAELEAVNEELTLYRRLVSTVRDYAIFMLDCDGTVKSWNLGAQQLSGYTPAEIIGRHFSVFYTEQDRARDHPADELRLAARDGRYEEEGWRLRKNGTAFWAHVTITAVHDDHGLLTGYAKVTRDLTEPKGAEQALRGAVAKLRAANEELERFATVAAHDMTDPLRTISGFAEILEHTDRSPEQIRQYAGHIHSSSARLTGMLRGLLTYARAGKSDDPPTAVDLGAAVGRVVADLTGLITDHQVRIELDVPSGMTVLANDNDVQLILQNLISNAIKFGDTHRPVVRVRAHAEPDGTCRAVVEDNGDGIPPEHFDRIFEAFQRGITAADRAGYGLGLAICQRLVERHRGRIGVESRLGEGSLFWFRLPLGLPHPAGEQPAAAVNA